MGDAIPVNGVSPRNQTMRSSPSWVSAVTPSSRPISSIILPSLSLEDGDAGEVHLPARVGGQAAGEEILEGRAGMGAATFPLADDVVALGYEVGRAPEVQIGERGAEIGHEGLDVFAA